MPKVHIGQGRITPERLSIVRGAETRLAARGYTGLDIEEVRDGFAATAWSGQKRASALGNTREHAAMELVRTIERK